MTTITYENQAAETGKFVDSDNNVIDVQEFLESGQVLVTATSSAAPVVPVAEATTPKYTNLAPWVGKFINSADEIIDLINFLTSGAIQVQVTGGVAPSNIAYVTVTDVTDVLPNSFPLSDLAPGYIASDGNGAMVGRELEETTNQINITNRTGVLGNPAFSLSSTLVLPGTLTLGGDLRLATYKITSSSGTPIQLIPDNDSDGIDLSSPIVRIDADLRHAGEPDNKFTFTTAAQTHYIGGSSIYDINASGFRLGMGYRVSTISNDAAAFLDTELMTAYAIQTLVGNAIIGSNNFRGGWDASGGLFPTTGGTGPAGAVAAGNSWRISVAGTLGGEPVDQGDQIIAATAVPGQTAANWIIVNPRVFSVFGRTGSVVAEDGDYPFEFISGLPDTATSGKLMRGTGSAWAETTATYPDTAASAGKILRADGANWVASTPTFPNAGTSGKLILGDGTNYVETTAQYPDTAGASGNVLTSDGTNWASSAPTFAAMTYSTVTASTQALAVNNAYRTTYAGLCVMSMPATAAVGSIIRVRAGPSGNTFKITFASGQLGYYGAQNGVSVATASDGSGYFQSADPNTTVDLECIVANTTWMVTSNVNNLDYA